MDSLGPYPPPLFKGLKWYYYFILPFPCLPVKSSFLRSLQNSPNIFFTPAFLEHVGDSHLEPMGVLDRLPDTLLQIGQVSVKRGAVDPPVRKLLANPFLFEPLAARPLID